MTSSTFIHVSTLPVRTACPVCGRQEIEIEVGCDLAEGVCFSSARCRACQTVHAAATEDPARQVNVHFDSLCCTQCGRKGAHTHLHLELDRRRFFHHVHCDYCCTLTQAPSGRETG